MSLSDAVAYVEWLLKLENFPAKIKHTISQQYYSDVLGIFHGSQDQVIKHALIDYYNAEDVPPDPKHMDLPGYATLDFVLLKSVKLRHGLVQNKLFFKFHYYLKGHQPLVEHLLDKLPDPVAVGRYPFKIAKHVSVYLVIDSTHPPRIALKIVSVFQSDVAVTPEQILALVGFFSRLRWNVDLVADASVPTTAMIDLQLAAARYFARVPDETFQHR